jgi:hypothetical protein
MARPSWRFWIPKPEVNSGLSSSRFVPLLGSSRLQPQFSSQQVQALDLNEDGVDESWSS